MADRIEARRCDELAIGRFFEVVTEGEKSGVSDCYDLGYINRTEANLLLSFQFAPSVGCQSEDLRPPQGNWQCLYSWPKIALSHDVNCMIQRAVCCVLRAAKTT